MDERGRGRKGCVCGPCTVGRPARGRRRQRRQRRRRRRAAAGQNRRHLRPQRTRAAGSRRRWRAGAKAALQPTPPWSARSGAAACARRGRVEDRTTTRAPSMRGIRQQRAHRARWAMDELLGSRGPSSAIRSTRNSLSPRPAAHRVSRRGTNPEPSTNRMRAAPCRQRSPPSNRMPRHQISQTKGPRPPGPRRDPR